MATKEEKSKPKSVDDEESIKVLEKEQPSALQLDTGNETIRSRKKWWQLWIPSGIPPLPPSSLDDAEVTAPHFLLTHTWITPIMMLGYQRTLQATDLWRVAYATVTSLAYLWEHPERI
ncbi:hypothetical protein DFH07DRAFT_958242 [Mycena maculata]|uniref:Uncharacterized protein n=1 Tax=Mycena maculata TaxID=230809 RepID=A0AAD7J972_9AGAR|nr:hypothetical protein DFH07DRAFT_958242 [Mycena maculata]